MDFSESFEKVVRACQASNDYMPVWEKFINTEFFITVLPQDTGSQTRDFRFAIYNSPKNDEPTVIVFETPVGVLRTEGCGFVIDLSGMSYWLPSLSQELLN